MTLKLQSGEWEAECRPETGGALSALRWRGTDILRPMPVDADGALESACFPLVPYCNRIRRGRFAWWTDDIAMPLNFPPQSHSLHGLGWQQAWKVESSADFKCALVHDHAGLGPRPWRGDLRTWPWAYQAEQRIRLGPKGCAVTLSVTNRSNVPMPAGLGMHPYFRRRPETRVRFNSNGMIMVGDTLIPNGEIVHSSHFADWSGGAVLPAHLIDHCFTDWDGQVQIEDDLGSITMTARGGAFLHAYSPEDGSALCFEPVSHMPDALNQDPAGMISLPPGCTASLQMWITAG